MKRLLSLWLMSLITVVCFSQLLYPQLTSLPTIYIETDLPINSKEIYREGKITIVSEDETECIYDSVIHIRGRGNSTWRMPKSPYRVKFNKKTRILNQKAKLKNWVLLANYADKSLIRNALANEVSQFLGFNFTPATRFVDVVVNGTYRGNYMVTDRVEVNPNRVEVTEQLPTDTEEDAITGGYLIELDGWAENEPVWFRTSRGMEVTVKSPKSDEINQQQRDYITQYTKNFESILFSSKYADPDEGYRAKVDTISLINWYIASELTGNSDAFWSVFMYKDRLKDKFYFGPLWDFDIAFNNDNRMGEATYKLMREVAHPNKIWIQRLWTDTWFRHAVNRRWQELVKAGLKQHLLDYITQTAAEIDESQKLNFKTWSIMSHRVHYEQKLFSTYEENIAYLKEYFHERVAFLTESFELTDNVSKGGEAFQTDDFYYSIMNVRTNNVIDIQDQSEEEDALLMLWNSVTGLESQQWIVENISDDLFMFINRHSGLAIKGNGQGNNLKQVSPDRSDKGQLWQIVPVSRGKYGIINQESHYSINNNGGSFENGNKVIEWTENVTVSQNQQWYIEKVEPIDRNTAITYSLNRKAIMGYYIDGYFVLDYHPEQKDINKVISVYSTTSRVLLMSEQVVEDKIDLRALPYGLYLIKVQIGEEVFVLKCMKN